MTDEARAKIEANLLQAREAAEKWRKALDAYDEAASNDSVEMRRTNMPEEPLASPSTPPQRQRVGPEIAAAVETIPAGQEFTLKDVFGQFKNKELEYEKSRPSISIGLAERAQAGKLTKVKRGTYVKPK